MAPRTATYSMCTFLPTDRNMAGQCSCSCMEAASSLAIKHGAKRFAPAKPQRRIHFDLRYQQYWGNIGNFYAHHGMVVVIVNHQLVPFDRRDLNAPPSEPTIAYPAGADDVQLAREWVYQNIESAEFGGGSREMVVLFGHSSGGAHIAMNLYAAGMYSCYCETLSSIPKDLTHNHAGDPERVPSETEVFPPVAGVIYLSVPFWYDGTRPIRQRILQRYYGSDSEEIWGVSLLFQRSTVAGEDVISSRILPTASECSRLVPTFTRQLAGPVCET